MTRHRLKQAAAASFAQNYGAWLDDLLNGGNRVAPNCLALAAARDAALRQAGFRDIFATVKAAENANALALLPDVCRSAITALPCQLKLLCAISIFCLQFPLYLQGLISTN